MSFESILETVVGDPGDRDTLKTLASRYPGLRESMLRQEDYSRKSNELQSRVQIADKWDTWRKENWDEAAERPKTQVAVEQLLSERERELAELRLNGGGEVTFEEMAQELPKHGFVTKKTFQDEIYPELSGQVNNEFQRMGSRFSELIADVPDLMMEHREQFKERLNAKELFTYMTTNKIADPRAAYAKMYEPRLTQAQKDAEVARVKAIDDRVAAAEAEGIKKGRLEVVNTSGRANPTDTTGGTESMGPLQLMKLRRAQKDSSDGVGDGLGPNVKLDDPVIAMQAAADYRRRQVAASD